MGDPVPRADVPRVRRPFRRVQPLRRRHEVPRPRSRAPRNGTCSPTTETRRGSGSHHAGGVPRREHDVLTDCLTAWAVHGGRGLLEHRQRIRDLVRTAAPPPPRNSPTSRNPSSDPTESTSSASSPPTWSGSAGLRHSRRSPGCSSRTRRGDGDDPLAYWFAGESPSRTTRSQDERPSDVAWRPSRRQAVGSAHGVERDWRRSPWVRGDPSEHVLRWLWILMEQEQARCYRGPGLRARRVDVRPDADPRAAGAPHECPTGRRDRVGTGADGCDHSGRPVLAR